MSYNTKAVARITGLSKRQIDYWDSSHFIKPSISEASGYGSSRLYSFSDLIQLKVAKTLIESGISLQKIRKAVNYLKKHMPEIESPLYEMKFITNGETIFVITKDTKKIIDTLNSGQFVFSIALGEIVEELKGDTHPMQEIKKYKVTVKGKKYDVLSEKDSVQGKYLIKCQLFPECFSYGETIEEALQEIERVIEKNILVKVQMSKAS